MTLEAVVPECDGVPEPVLEVGGTCAGGANGSVVIILPGGAGENYSFSWSNGQTDAVATGLPAGTYCVTITSAEGCTRTTCAEVQSIQTISVSGHVVPICGEQAGSLVMNAEGGTSPYHYQWKHNNMFIPGQQIHSTNAGLYIAEVWDANGCQGSAEFELPSYPAVSLSASLQPATCSTNPDGAILLMLGGASSYTFQWSNGATSPSLQNVPGGNYCVTVTAGNGCSASDCFNIAPTEPQVRQPYLQELSVWAVQTTTAQEDLLYHTVWEPTGSNCLALSGGMQQLDPSVLTEMEQGMRIVRIEARFSEEMAVPVSVGGENALFSDNMTSSDGINWVRLVNALPASSLISSGMLDERLIFSGSSIEGHSLFNMNNQQGTNCVVPPQLNPNSCQWELPYDNSGRDDLHRLITDCMVINFDINFDAGNIKAIVSGGVAPFSYDWTNEAGQQVGTSHTIYNMPLGRYCLVVKDDRGCKVEKCVQLCKPIQDLIGEIINIERPCPGQSDGSVCVSPPEDGSWTFVWQNGSTANCIESVGAGEELCLTISEQTCMQTMEYCTKPIEALPPPSLQLISSQPACSGQHQGMLQVSANGGRGPYTYVWSNGQTGHQATGLTTGACYGVTVTDACGQTASGCYHVPAPNTISLSTLRVTPSCGSSHNGAIELAISGGIGPFTFSWSGSNQFSQTTQQPSVVNLAPGNYSVTATDACGQTAVRNNAIPNLSPNLQIQLSTNEIGHICPSAAETSGFIDITAVSPSNSSLTFAWNTGQTSEDIHNLSAGNYRLTVTDQAGCQLIGVYGVLSSHFAIQGAKVRDAFCNFDNGYVEVEVQQTSPEHGQIQYQWSNGQTGPNIQNLAPGTYTVTVSDETGCELTESFTVGDQSDEPSLEIRLVNLINVQYDPIEGGSIDISVTGQYGPYSYQWSTGAITEDVSSLPSGTYTVIVTDQTTGCTATATYKIEPCSHPQIYEGPDGVPHYEYVNYYHEPEISISVTPLTALTANDGALNATINSGGAPNYFVEWTGPNGFYSTEEDIYNLVEGVYCLRVWNGCFETQKCQRVAYCGDFMVIGQVTQSAYGDEICFFRGSAPVTIQLNVQNANGNYTTN